MSSSILPFDPNNDSFPLPEGYNKTCPKEIKINASGSGAVLAIIEQKITGAENIAGFLTNVDEIKRKAGLDFLADLPDDLEKEMEAQVAEHMWW